MSAPPAMPRPPAPARGAVVGTGGGRSGRGAPVALVARGLSVEQLEAATRLLDVAEVAARTRLSTRFWRDEIAVGGIASVKAGRRRLVSEAALLAWIAARTTPATRATS